MTGHSFAACAQASRPTIPLFPSHGRGRNTWCQSFLVALDAPTGREIWRVTRDERSNWATPFVWEHEDRAQIVTSGSDKVRAYDLEGRPTWELTGMSSIAIPTPFAAHGLLFVSSGYVGDAQRPMYAIDRTATGDISLTAGEPANAHIAWSHPQLGSYNTSALVYGDYLYTLLDRGFLLAHDAKTGREVYGRQRLAPDAAVFTASPWAYNGKIFAASEDGDTFVIQAGAAYKVLGRHSLGEMPAPAAPAPVHPLQPFPPVAPDAPSSDTAVPFYQCSPPPPAADARKRQEARRWCRLASCDVRALRTLTRYGNAIAV
jgi:hypothetical protein